MARGKGTGRPKTQLGKLASSKNALKTGAYSVQQILPGEKQEDFEELHQMFKDDFQPIGVTEASLVHEIALLAWKKLRLERIENQYLYGVLNATPTSEEFFAAGLPRKDDIVWLLEDLSVITEQFIRDHKRYLDWANHADDSDLTQEDIDRLKQEDPQLYSYLKRDAFDRGNNSNQLQRIVITWKGQKDEDPELTVNKVNNMLEKVIKESKSVLYVAKHMDHIEEIKQLIRDRRLKTFMESTGPIRAYQDLSRAFFKVLEELRKQQDWRLKNKTLES